MKTLIKNYPLRFIQSLSCRGRGGFKSRHATTAFTLIEIMLVMVILSILAGAITIELRDLHNELALQEEVDIFNAAVKSARQYAIINKVICRLDLDEAQGRYYLTQAGSIDELFKPVSLEIGQVRIQAEGIVITHIIRAENALKSRNQIHFFPDGHSETAEVIFQNNSKNTIKVQIDSL